MRILVLVFVFFSVRLYKENCGLIFVFVSLILIICVYID